jgi:hypothetical protein
MREILAAPHISTKGATTRPTREKFSCSGDQFDIIVAFAVSHDLFHAPFHFVVSEYTRTRLH